MPPRRKTAAAVMLMVALGAAHCVPSRADYRTKAEAAMTFIVAASPSTLDAIAVEPQTHAPHGLRRLLAGEPGGLTLLEPHETLSVVARLGFEQLAE